MKEYLPSDSSSSLGSNHLEGYKLALTCPKKYTDMREIPGQKLRERFCSRGKGLPGYTYEEVVVDL